MINTVLPEEIIITDSNALVDSVNVSVYDKVFVLVDENTEHFCLHALEESGAIPDSRIEICVPPGEEYKSLTYCEHIWDVMIQHEASRNSCLIVLGGGVLCDMGAMAASLFKRGVDYFLLPTTLLAQIDASVGGKTAVNYHGIKNQIGCFSSPKEVIINPDFLKTLPQRHLNAGYFEMLKHGILSDDQHYKSLLMIKKVDAENIAPLIWPSLQIKAAVVQEDPYEKNLRKALNFGHTVGHALESFSYTDENNTSLLHGEAVALGMIAELAVAERKFDLKNNIKAQLQNKAKEMIAWRFYSEDVMEIIGFMIHDKKNSSGTIKMALPVNDEIALNVEVGKELLEEVLEELRLWLNKNDNL